MAAETVRVVARLVARPDAVDEARSVLTGLIEPTRAEPGCVSYELLQNVEDPTDFTFVEEWADAESFQAHLETEHFGQAAEALPDLLVEEPDIRRYRTVA